MITRSHGIFFNFVRKVSQRACGWWHRKFGYGWVVCTKYQITTAKSYLSLHQHLLWTSSYVSSIVRSTTIISGVATFRVQMALSSRRLGSPRSCLLFGSWFVCTVDMKQFRGLRNSCTPTSLCTGNKTDDHRGSSSCSCTGWGRLCNSDPCCVLKIRLGDDISSECCMNNFDVITMNLKRKLMLYSQKT